MDALRERGTWWWRPLAAALAGTALVVGSWVVAAKGDAAVEARLDTATSFATVRVGAVLTRELTADEVGAPLDEAEVRELVVVLQAEVMTRPAVVRVRVWSPDGVVVFSTADLGEAGTAPGGPRPIADALAGTVVARSVVEPFPGSVVGGEASPTRVWETWAPLRTADSTLPQGAVEVDQVQAAVVGGAGDDDRRLASVFRWLAVAAFVTAAALAVVTARRFRTPPEDRVGGVRPAASADADADIAIAEAAHERDVSIARAEEAEERERLARDRLEALAPLEERVSLAERRALDAERRLDEIAERVEAAAERDAQEEGPPDEPLDAEEPSPAGNDPNDASARRAAELRARLARSAAQKPATKKPPPDR